jgi:hypothetical protein
MIAPMLRRALAVLAVLAAPVGVAAAAPCGPAATIAGEPSLVAAIAPILAARALTDGAPECPTLAVTVSARDGAVVVAFEHRGQRLERAVADAATAATVIESFVRGDVAAPLLAPRMAPPREPGAGEPPASLAPPAPVGTRGRVHLFLGPDAALARDGTRWLGAQIGACITLGPVCAAVRHRLAQVVSGPGEWEHSLDRRAIELLVGIDVPLTIGSVHVTPGFAGGIGQIDTRDRARGIRVETGGLRADVHATIGFALTRRWAIELAAAGVLTQATHVENLEGKSELPREARLLGHLGVGVRYGGL